MASEVVDKLASGVKKLGVDNKGSTENKLQLNGVTDSRYNGEVIHYRGIPYATVAKRFAKPELIKSFPGKSTDFTKFGPRCPQISFDTRDFLMISKSIPKDEDPLEDELKCTNLNVTCPSAHSSSKLPVFVWIYGGSMSVGYGDAQQRLGDAGPLVAQSIELGKPVILVTIHYRLNIFGFGDGETGINLSHQDQKAAIQWVKNNIAYFGGDPSNITVGGESAGGIYVHALLAAGVKFERAILQSGSLYSSPPQPEKAGFGLVGLIEGNLQLMEFDKGNQSGDFGPGASIAGASAADLIQTLQDLQIARFWLWDEKCFKDWHDDKRVLGGLKGLLVGDCKHEWNLFYLAFQKMTAPKILECFQTKQDPAVGIKIAKAYGIDGLQEDHATARQAALHFMADSRFCAWTSHITSGVNNAGGQAYSYYYDESNPFMPEDIRVAGHGSDLFALFGGYDEHVGDNTARVGRMLRTKWIDFINGEEPWGTNETFVFGPDGMDGAIDRDSNAAVHDLNPRRRQAGIAAIREAGWQTTMGIWQTLTAAARNSME